MLLIFTKKINKITMDEEMLVSLVYSDTSKIYLKKKKIL